MFGKKLGSAGRLSVGLALASASLALAVSAARADPYSPYGGTTAGSVEGVTVYAPYRYIRHPTTGAMVRMNSVSMAVSLADLDLSTPGGARLAKARIVEAAKDVCQRAEDVYPGSGEPPGGCYAMAVHDALRQAQDQAGYPIVAWGYR
ncbi:MAG TPA: UrcA family protein [Caulobacteraceae bacterium]|nr:UrcA family protein [Caulobacteraceae bacterium]